MLRINILLFLAAAGVGACTIVLENHCASNAGNFSCPSGTPWCNSCANKTDCQLEEPEDSCKAFSPDHCASQTVEPGGADAYCADKDGGVRPICDGCVRENDGCVAERTNPPHCYGDDTGTGSSSGGTENTGASGSSGSTGSSGSPGSTSSTGSTGSSGTTTGPMPCVGHAECAAMGAGTDYCKLSTGECVPCLEDVHCTAADAAACNTTANDCEACGDNDDCMGVAGMDLCVNGVCVQCTPEMETACNGKVCSALTNTCTDADPASSGLCEVCEADSQCEAGQLCVEQFYMGQGIDHYCFAEQQGGTCSPPMAAFTYSEALSVTSVEGVSAVICALDNTTCPARLDYGQQSGCKSDEVCGVPNLDDGFCRPKMNDTNRCTYFCTGLEDCPETKGCDTTEGLCEF